LREFRRITQLARSSKKAAILSHRNADPDALCSAYALHHLLRQLNKRIKIHLIAPEGVSRVTRQVLTRIRMKIHEPLNIDGYDAIFTVDTNTLAQLGRYEALMRSFDRPIVVIDHHNPDPETLKISSHVISDESATSTAEIIYRLYVALGLRPSRNVALALFLGIAYDSRHFALASSRAFRIASELVSVGFDARKAMRLLQVPMSESEKIARLKGSQRLLLRRVKGWALAATHVGSHQASVARALITLGADVAIVAGEKKGRLRISLRSTQEFYERTAIHLGRDIARPIGEMVEGTGGGHALSSGVCGHGEVKAALEKCLDAVTKKLQQKEANTTGGSSSGSTNTHL
jgi:phosphoesterase RecJ-like protein